MWIGIEGPPFHSHVLDFAVFVLESIQYSVDDFVTKCIIKNTFHCWTEKLVCKVTCCHETKVGIYNAKRVVSQEGIDMQMQKGENVPDDFIYRVSSYRERGRVPSRGE